MADYKKSNIPNGIKPKQDRKFIFIGDSYGAGYGLSDTTQNWIEYTADYLNLGSESYWSSAITGAGFIGQSTDTTFLEQLKSLDYEENSGTLYNGDYWSVTDIVVAGGWNDNGQSESDLNDAFEEFMTYCREFFPNATVWLAYISWVDSYKRYTSATNVNPTYNLREALRIYENAGAYGFSFIGNMQYVLHNMNYFQSDGLHPTASGQQAIARHLSSALQGGIVNVQYYLEAGFTKASGVSSVPSIYTMLDNNEVVVNFYNMSTGPQFIFSSDKSLNGAGFNPNTGTYITLGTFDDNVCCRGGRYSELQWHGFGYVQDSSGTNHLENLVFRIGRTDEGKSSTLEVGMTSTTGSSYTTYSNVRMIWLPTPNVFMKALSMYC